MHKLTIINDQHLFSGIFTYTYKIYTNFVSNGVNGEFYQFLIYNDHPPLSTIHVKKGILSFLSSKSKIAYNTKLAWILYI